MATGRTLLYMNAVFGKKKVMTRKELMDTMSVSTTLVSKRLKSCGGYTSYNKNGKYYTLPSIAEFNEQGLWEYEGIRFSKFGNLKRTLIGLIDASECGLYVEVFIPLLGYSPHAILSELYEKDLVYREKRKGKFIYLSIDETIRQGQAQEYEVRLERETQKLITDETAVRLLMEKIKQPDASAKALAETLNTGGVYITEQQVIYFFEKNDLEKKTPSGTGSA